MTDTELKETIQRALDWEPGLNSSDIGVDVDEAVVTLRGKVASDAQKTSAERVTLNIYGVKAIANDLIVQMGTAPTRSDTELARAAVAALKWNTRIPDGRLTVIVDNGWVTLNGTLDWRYQKEAAARTVRELVGVKGITDNVDVTPPVESNDVGEDRPSRRHDVHRCFG